MTEAHLVVTSSEKSLRPYVERLIAAGTRVTAVADREPTRLAEALTILAELGQPAPVAFADPVDMFRRHAADSARAVVVVSPSPLDPQLVIAALRAGVHLLVEKPQAGATGHAYLLLAARGAWLRP